MKNVPFLFVLACLFTLVLHAQHRPFVVEGKRWIVEYNESGMGYFHYYLGIATSDFNINENYRHCGWYLYVWNQRLYSQNQDNIAIKDFNADVPKNEVKIVVNMKERTLKFIIDGKDNGIAFKDIPLDKPLYPAIFMYYTNDSLQFIKN